MKSSFLAACLAGIAVLVIFGGWKTRDPFYRMPIAQVNDVLDQTDLPEEVFMERAATATHWRVDATTSMWAIMSKERVELLRLSATTTAAGWGTRVRVDVLPPESKIRDQVAQALKQNPGYREYFNITLAEQIESKLTKRPLNAARIADAMTLLTLRSLPRIRENSDAVTAAHEKKRQDAIDRVYDTYN